MNQPSLTPVLAGRRFLNVRVAFVATGFNLGRWIIHRQGHPASKRSDFTQPRALRESPTRRFCPRWTTRFRGVSTRQGKGYSFHIIH